MVKVRLRGLNITRAGGRFYVYNRATGDCLLRGFAGTREDLQRHLESVEFIDKVQALRRKDRRPVYAPGTLGALADWFRGTPKWASLSDATRADYDAAFRWLERDFDAGIETIDQASVYQVRNEAAAEKWPRFADKMVAALSSMFGAAVEVGKMAMNPARGVKKTHKANPNANREWTAEEWKAAADGAAERVLSPMMIARYAGFRGQTIASLKWSHYQSDPRYGRCFRIEVRKNSEPVWVPVVPELQAYLDGLDKRATTICVSDDGRPWKGEKVMQGAVSRYLRKLEKDGKIGPGLTLHGLRVTYAAELARDGSNTGEVAAALGDRSERMGAHYTRHVESEAKVIRAFDRKRK